MELKKSYVDSLAINSSSILNAEKLANSSKLLNLSISNDETLYFGECSGSGSKNYIVSVDFVEKTSPVFRCSCPSRQIPCKHSLSILYAYINGKNFSIAEIPEDVLSKRNKITKSKEKKENAENEINTNPKKISKAKQTANIKKIDSMLIGIENAEKILFSLSNIGLASIDANQRKIFNEQIKNLGNYYINGIQNSLLNLLDLIKNSKNSNFHDAISQGNYIFSLLSKSKYYLKNKKIDPENNIDLKSPLEELIGYAWKLDELIEKGCFILNAKLIQLSFNIYKDEASETFIDEGYYIELTSKNLFKTKNYRPFKALKYIKTEDSVFDLINVEKLVVYPGEPNPRIRFDNYSLSEIKTKDYEMIKEISQKDFKEVVKNIKNFLKSPISDKNPLSLVKVCEFNELLDKNYIEIVDDNTNTIILSDIVFVEEPFYNSFLSLIKNIDKDIYLLLMFENNLADNLLVARPLSLISENKIISCI